MAEPPSATGAVDTDTEVLGGAPAKPVEPAAPRAPLIGRTLGKFTIVERLGRGGSGEVFRAEQAQLGRSAVIKVLRSDLAPSPNRVERFLREARLASTLDHPYAAHIYAFGAEPDGVLWIAMEHVRGTTLDEVIARCGPMPPSVFAPLFERLCEVIHSAHELAIIHRDIKLANVMVIERSGQLLPKLLDFGIAKAQGDDLISPGGGRGGGVITGHGATIGSPPYMAPEQWQRPHDVDGRADIYALGVLAYRCLSGRPPIPGGTRAELAHAHLHVTPKPLGVGPPALDEAIRKALAKAPEQRWPRALDFAAAVRKAIGAGAGEAVPILDEQVREVWEKTGPQPIAEAVARVASAATTVECDDAVRDLVDVTCRWLAAIALAGCRAEMIAPFATPIPAEMIAGDVGPRASGLGPRGPRDQNRDADSSEPGEPTPDTAAPVVPALDPSEPEARGPRPEAREAEAREAEARGPRPEAGDAEPEARGPRPEAREGAEGAERSPFARPRASSQMRAVSSHDTSVLVTLRERTRDLAKADHAAAWLAVARAACDVVPALPELPDVLARATTLDEIAARQATTRRGRTAGDLAADVAAIGDMLAPLDPLLAYRLVIGGEDGPEAWAGVRQRNRPRALVWGDAVAVGEVVMLDGAGHIALRLSPLVRAQRPLPHGDLELFLIARTGKGVARLAATPWGFEHDDEEAGQFLAHLSTADSSSIEDVDVERSPYPGLAAYAVEDADRFFGREREIDALANRLVRAPMVAVVGPSGVGKSSFVHAGVVARLREQYRVVTLRPGRHPTESLHAAIEKEALSAAQPAKAGGAVAASGRRFPVDDAELIDRLRALGERASRGVVVIVDQLEEITTLCADAADRERFARVLGAAAATSTSPVRVVATLRDDFASLLESIDGFRDHYEVFVLGAPSPDALRRILLEPARRAGVSLEAGLVDDIVGEIAGRAAALPLLGFTAARLWHLRDRDQRIMTRSAYQVVGGVAGALATYADEVFASLGKKEQAIARDVFARLVAADGTRVPMPRAELAAIDGGSGVVDRLVDARLLTAREADPDPAGGEATADAADDLVEIVHECLAERWPRLVRWRSEDAADRALVTDLRAAARRWHEQQRPVDLLWRGAALDDLRRLAERSSSLTAREREFAAASLAAARRRVRIRRVAVGAVIVGLAGVALVMAYLMNVADKNAAHAADSEKTAKEQAALAEKRYTSQLRAAGQRELVEGRPMNALAYLGEVLRRGLDDDGVRLMVGQTSWVWPYEKRSFADHQVITGTDDGTWFAISPDRFKLTFIDGAARELGKLEMASFLQGLVVEPNDERIMLLSEQAVEIAPRADPAQRKKILDVTRTDDVYRGCFGPAPDEITITFGKGEVRTYGLDGVLRRKVDTGQTMVLMWECSQDAQYVLIVSPTQMKYIDLRTMTTVLDSSTAYSMGSFADDGVFLLDTVDGKLEVHARDGSVIARWKSVAGPHMTWLADDGTHVVVSTDREITVFDMTGKVTARMGGFRGGITAVRFVGGDLWTGGNDGMVRRWSYKGVQLASVMGVGGYVHDVQPTPTGLVAASERGVRYWEGVPALVEPAGAASCSVSFSVVARDRPVIGVICAEKKIEIYDADTRRASVIPEPRDDFVTAIDAAGNYVANWDWLGVIRLWTVGGERLAELTTKEAMSVGWVAGKLWVATYLRGSPEKDDFYGELLEIDPATGTPRTLPWVPRHPTLSIQEVPGGHGAIVYDEKGTLVLLGPDGTEARRVVTGVDPGHTFAPIATVSSGGGHAVVGGTSALKIYTLPALVEVRRVDTTGAAVVTASLDPDGATLVTTSVDHRASIWSVASGELVTQVSVGDVAIYDAAFCGSRDRLMVFAGEFPYLIKLPRATGTREALAAEIACRVPLRPEGGALVATKPTCP